MKKQTVALPLPEVKESALKTWLKKEAKLHTLLHHKRDGLTNNPRISSRYVRHLLSISWSNRFINLLRLVSPDHLSMQERRYQMNKPRFRIEKTTHYSDKKREFEEYTIYGYGGMMCSAIREEIEELYEQLGIALNDRKEETDEKQKK